MGGEINASASGESSMTMRHYDFLLAFSKLWTRIRGFVAPQPTAASQAPVSNQLDITRERDRQPLQLYLF
jgi:hypothetical protein